jgi:phosphatidate cytidylyltransferase
LPSFTAAIAVMAPSPDRNRDRRILLLRILSSLVLAPLALAAVWYGHPAFELMLLVAGVLMAGEAADLVGGGTYRTKMMLLAAILLLPPLLRVPVVASLAAAVVAALLLYILVRQGRAAPWLAGGLLLATVPCIAFAWLRSEVEAGRVIIFWILAIAWATDIGAFALGRLIGGPKLAPRISPNKTWAGLIGGLACALAAGLGIGLGAAALGWIPSPPSLVVLAAASAAASLIGQAGDLAESAAKRRFGAKDSGHLIPGHGGLLDRVDSLLAIIPSVALVVGLARGDGMLWP